jgi:PD-(D/E)XK nuclease superfamily protein
MSRDDLGPVYTSGRSFRAHAEARQREYRAKVLRVGWSEHGHFLNDVAASAGRNFVVPEAFEQAKLRASAGKGVNEKRTFSNMLSSQAMCFNVFSPLALDLGLAATVLKPFFPRLAEVRAIVFEHTPANSVFGDQTGRGGVDCDLLVDAVWDDGSNAVITIETKFVEPEFSVCGFRKPGRGAKGQATCPEDVPVAADHGLCLYAAKGYRYWEQTARLATLGIGALSKSGCPFGGPEWQLWVNHTLAHAEADTRGARHAVFAVCAPAANTALLRGGVLDTFRARLANPETFRFVPLDDLVAHIGIVASERPGLMAWANGLVARYAAI